MKLLKSLVYTTQQIKKWNNISGNKIIAGKTLKIYSSSNSVLLTEIKQLRIHSNVNYYKIKSGDSIGSIADKYGVKISDLQRWNKISGNKILVW